MHKIRCPRCGVVNLEKFVTYPHCAGCGVTLPQPDESAPFWKRPLSLRSWILAIGAALAGLLAIATLLQPPTEEQDTAVIYGTATRTSVVGGLVLVTLTVDALSAARSRQNEPLRDVKLRLPLELFDDLRFVSLSPQPNRMTISGRSRYFHYYSLPRESTLTLRLRAVKPGQKRIRVSLYAEGLLPGEWKAKMRVKGTAAAWWRGRRLLGTT